MKTLEAQVPEILIDEVRELAARQNTSVDQIAAIALVAQVPPGALGKSLILVLAE